MFHSAQEIVLGYCNQQPRSADIVGGIIALLLIATVVRAVTQTIESWPFYCCAGPGRHRFIRLGCHASRMC